MIERVVLTAWKSFSELDLQLEPGVSFIVARNGSGKTSLLQGLHFGMFGGDRLIGSGSPLQSAIRGTGPARVSLDVRLDGALWSITRTVSEAPPRSGASSECVVLMDGQESSKTDWEHALERASGVSLTELRLLSAIGEGTSLRIEGDASAEYDVVRHVADVLGVSRLRREADRLRSASIRLGKEADRKRLDRRDRAARTAKRQRPDLESRVELAGRGLSAARRSLAEANQNVAASEEWLRWRASCEAVEARARSEFASLQRATQRMMDLVPDLAEDLMRRWEGTALRAGAGAMDADRQAAKALLDERQDELTIQVGRLGAEIDLNEALARHLAHSRSCPTCSQSLSDDAHHSLESRCASELDSARAGRTVRVAALDALRDVRGVLESISWAELVLPTRPEMPPPDAETRDLAMLEREVADADGRVREAEAELRALDEAERVRQSDDLLSDELVSEYREADLTSLMAEAMSSVAKQVARERIEPLAVELSKKWSEFWSGRPTLDLDSDDGALTGEVLGRTVSRADLSGGERAVSNVLLRLLAMQAASSCPVLLLDEPLEHLDAQNRRMLAAIIVAASAAVGVPRQVILTTYEESVARRLRDPDVTHARVVYVGPTPTD